MAKIVITARSVANSKEGRDILEAAGHQVITRTGDGPWSQKDMAEIVTGMDAAIVGLDEISEDVIKAGVPSLKVVARNGVGYNKVDVKAAREHGVQVTLAPGTNTVSVCELVFGLMLSSARNILLQDQQVRKGGWNRIMGCELFEKVLGVIGTGNIGTEVIKRARAFGMKVLAFDVTRRDDIVEQYGVEYVRLDDIYQQADFITLHVPATLQTKGMINSGSLQLMKNTAIIINTARGDLICEEDLYAALTNGKIAGYGADAMIQEPPGDNHPLLSLTNVIITPHCGAYTKEAVIRCSVTAAQEVIRVLNGEAPLYAVTD